LECHVSLIFGVAWQPCEFGWFFCKFAYVAKLKRQFAVYRIDICQIEDGELNVDA